jgi:phosphoglycolate phosphatase
LVALFDIDGTLIDAGGAGRRAFEKAAITVFGSAEALADLRFDGLTDRFIARAAIERARANGPASYDEITQLIDAYLARLADEVRDSAKYRVLPGVPALLARLVQEKVRVGLCTGNVEMGARHKLVRGQLNQYFQFGGFGDDGEHRHEVVRAALKRASARIGHEVDPSEVWLVGDTPKDLEGGRACGVKVLLVASGRHSLDELHALGPDRCVESLADPTVSQCLLPL